MGHRIRCAASWRRSSIRAKATTKIIQAFITKYGSEEMLGAPIDKGVQPPGVAGAQYCWAHRAPRPIGFAAVKWTRKPARQRKNVAIDSALEERIDDELRDLNMVTRSG